MIDYNSINGEQATTLMLGVMSNKSNNFNTPALDDIPYKPMKVYYSNEQPTIDTMKEVKRNYITHYIIDEPLPSYTINTTGVNEMINKITDKT